MEAGDHITITVTPQRRELDPYYELVKECGTAPDGKYKRKSIGSKLYPQRRKADIVGRACKEKELDFENQMANNTSSCQNLHRQAIYC
ncbi:unnamed protein product [Lactuca virosa]|uniref:Uncharacterized protein n=1 Tax=Lactuca virosa TaxID=75947 RepID=A0AAU9NSR0_9ASTR|nr:unnamed protein product [Lactuca virosa]